ncbi:hypothetical protein ACHAXN_007144 [Cyclotella atomus]
MPRIPKGFQLRGAVKENHKHPIYAVAWSPHIHTDCISHSDGQTTISYFATCAGPCAAIYEVVTTSVQSTKDGRQQAQPPVVRQVYRDVDDDETFYTCAFGGRGVGSPVGYAPVGSAVDTSEVLDGTESSDDGATRIIYFGKSNNDINASDSYGSDGEASSKPPLKRQKTDRSTHQSQFLFPFSSTQDGPPLLCLAGTRGIIKVIDTVRRSLFLTLSGHGDEITDLQFSPTNEWLLLSASYDESIRLWNLQRGTNVAVFTGHDGHRRQVLSVSWHFSGTKFASCAMDNIIKLWNVIGSDGDNSAGSIEAAIEESQHVMPNDFPKHEMGNNGNATPVETKFKPIVQQTPYFSTNKVHTDYVDCVQFVGDLILSKSVHNKVVLWKPILDKDDNTKLESPSSIENNDSESAESSSRIPSGILFLREFTLSHCNSWFVRFHSPSPYHRILALGNQKGEVKVWQIGGEKGCNPDAKFYCNLTTSNVGGMHASNSNDNGGCTVRMVKFSPDASCLVAVCDDGTIWMWEAS